MDEQQIICPRCNSTSILRTGNKYHCAECKQTNIQPDYTAMDAIDQYAELLPAADPKAMAKTWKVLKKAFEEQG